MLRGRAVVVRHERGRPGPALVFRIGEADVVGLDPRVRGLEPVRGQRAVIQPQHRRDIRPAQEPIVSRCDRPHRRPAAVRAFRELQRRHLSGLLDPTGEHAAAGRRELRLEAGGRRRRGNRLDRHGPRRRIDGPAAPDGDRRRGSDGERQVDGGQNGFLFTGWPFRNSCDSLKNPVVFMVSVTGCCVRFCQYHPWMPGNGAA